MITLINDGESIDVATEDLLHVMGTLDLDSDSALAAIEYFGAYATEDGMGVIAWIDANADYAAEIAATKVDGEVWSRMF